MTSEAQARRFLGSCDVEVGREGHITIKEFCEPKLIAALAAAIKALQCIEIIAEHDGHRPEMKIARCALTLLVPPQEEK